MLIGWNELQNNREDRFYSIGNTTAELSIRNFIVNRKNSMFYSSEEGIEIASI